MDKIWILKSKYSYKLVKTEADLLRRIHKNSSFEVLEFDLKTSTRASDYLLSKERDLQLKSVLGELSEFEQLADDLIKLYEELAPDGRISMHYNRDTHQRIETTEKSSWLSRMKKFQDNKVQFKKLITDEKDYFLGVSYDLRWMKALLKCHNFVDCKKFRWDNTAQRTVEDTDPKTFEVFMQAKSELKKKK
jgi:hypothetical protein